MVITSLLGGAGVCRQEAERRRAGRGAVAEVGSEGRSPVTTSESLRARRLVEIQRAVTSPTPAHLV